jgi:hypothetical protein
MYPGLWEAPSVVVVASRDLLLTLVRVKVRVMGLGVRVRVKGQGEKGGG